MYVLLTSQNQYENEITQKHVNSEAEFKEFGSQLKYGWFHLKFYAMFQDLRRRSIETGF